MTNPTHQLNQLAQIYACALASEWEEVEGLDLTPHLTQAANDLATKVIDHMKTNAQYPRFREGHPPTTDDWVNQGFWPARDERLLNVLDTWHKQQISHILQGTTP